MTSLDQIKTLLSEYKDDLDFTEEKERITIKPNKFLGYQNLGKIATIIRQQNGEYVSQGKNGFFTVPKPTTQKRVDDAPSLVDRVNVAIDVLEEVKKVLEGERQK